MKSRGGIKAIQAEGDRLVVAFFVHDGIFHARLRDREVCERIQEAFRKSEAVAFTFDRKLRILSVP